MVFLYILEHTMMPLFTLVLIGYLVDRKYNIQVKTLSKLLFYLIIPSFIFTNIYKTDFPSNSLNILLCVFAMLVICWLLANIISRWRRYDAGMIESCRNALMFNNTGNLGVALIILVFSHEPFVVNGETPYLAEALVVWIIIFVVQSCGLNTIGLYQAGRGRLTAHDTMKVMLQMPIIYVFALAVLCRTVGYQAETFYFWPIMEMAAKAITPVAMFSIGVQMSQTKIEWFNREVWLVTGIKFFLMPILGLMVIYVANLIAPGTFTAVGSIVFLIYCGIPTAVNTAMYAMEFDNNPNYATQVVMNTTALSAISLTLVIWVGHLIFI